MNKQAEKAFKEMLEISTDVDKAILFVGDEVVVSNFSESLQPTMVRKARELSAAGATRAADMGSAPLTQLVIESPGGTVFLVQEAKDGGMGMLATAKKDSRIGLVFYDMKTCIRDTQEVYEEPEVAEEPKVTEESKVAEEPEPEVEA